MNKKGFTLIELLVVISIIGLLSTMAVVSLNDARIKARDAKRKADLAQVWTALQIYYDDHLKYPECSTLDNPTVDCWNNTLSAALANGSKPIIYPLPSDPLNTENYVYKYAGTKDEFVIHYETEDTKDASPQIIRGW